MADLITRLCATFPSSAVTIAVLVIGVPVTLWMVGCAWDKFWNG